MPKLDGTEALKPTPFDAHEQVVRGQHEFDKEKGYVAADPVHTLNAKGEPVAKNQYPKVVGYAEPVNEFLPAEPIIAKDAKHEAELTKKKEK